MKIWFDTEFIEDGRTIDLISIGMVREDGATYYAECAECDLGRADEWVVENVFPHLTSKTTSRAQIASDIIAFAGEKPEFWAYYADYDWVALCQLYGRMIDLPKGWPMFCRDLKQMAMDRGNPELPKQETGKHDALADAQWNKFASEFLARRSHPTAVEGGWRTDDLELPIKPIEYRGPAVDDWINRKEDLHSDEEEQRLRIADGLSISTPPAGEKP